MNSLQYYFNNHTDIKTIMAIISEAETIGEIMELFPLLEVDHIIFLTSDLRIEEAIKNILQFERLGSVTDVFDIKEFKNNIKVDALIFDFATKQDDIISLRKVMPRYLVGSIQNHTLSYFDIWESYRDISDNIYIRFFGIKEEYFDWKRNKTDIELSIIFPVYNVGQYIEQCIKSVVAWKASYVEFLFVNDGSPDNSRDIILEYQKTDARIRLLDKQNGGCASARKLGMEQARGRYIGFVDPDDYVDERMLQKLLMQALIGEYDVSSCGYNEYYQSTGETHKVTGDVLFSPYSEGTTDPILIQQLMMFSRIAIWRRIYKAEFLNNNQISFHPEFRRFDDLPFCIEVFAAAKSVISLPEYLYYYRLERPGQDVACKDERLYVHFDIFRYLDKAIQKYKNRRLLDHLFISKVNTHLFGIKMIDNQYLHGYLKLARRDLKVNMPIIRGAILAKKYVGRRRCFAYLLIMLHVGRLLKLFSFRGQL